MRLNIRHRLLQFFLESNVSQKKSYKSSFFDWDAYDNLIKEAWNTRHDSDCAHYLSFSC